MADYRERIVLLFDSIFKGQERIDQVSSRLRAFQDRMRGVSNTVRNFTAVQQLSNQQFKDQYVSLTKNTNAGYRYGAAIRNATLGMEGFRSELLSLLFFGMFLTNMMRTLTNGAGQTMGIFDIWGTTLELLFLPIMQALLPYFTALLDWVASTPDSVKLVIGALTILAGIFGFLITLFATFTFGIGSIISNLGVLAPLVKAIGFIFTGLSATVAAVIAGIIIVILGFIDAFRRDFLGMKSFVNMIWIGIKNMVTGAIDVIMGSIGVLVGLFTGDMEKVKSSFVRIWDGIKSFGKGIIEYIVGLLGVTVVTIINILYRIGEAVSNAFVVVWDLLKDFASAGWEAGKDFVSSLVDGIKSAPGKLIDAIKSILPDWALSAVNTAFGAASSISSSVSGMLPSFNDFIWRPGEGAIKINPNDNLVGFKGAPPSMGKSGGQSVVLNVNYDIRAGDNNEMRRLIEENNRKLLGEVKRLI